MHTRTFPLTPDLREVLEQQRTITDDLQRQLSQNGGQSRLAERLKAAVC
jgi:hypothetical protein